MRMPSEGIKPPEDEISGTEKEFAQKSTRKF
jgi:hypothetical protein